MHGFLRPGQSSSIVWFYARHRNLVGLTYFVFSVEFRFRVDADWSRSCAEIAGLWTHAHIFLLSAFEGGTGVVCLVLLLRFLGFCCFRQLSLVQFSRLFGFSEWDAEISPGSTCTCTVLTFVFSPVWHYSGQATFFFFLWSRHVKPSSAKGEKRLKWKKIPKFVQAEAQSEIMYKIKDHCTGMKDPITRTEKYSTTQKPTRNPHRKPQSILNSK